MKMVFIENNGDYTDNFYLNLDMITRVELETIDGGIESVNVYLAGQSDGEYITLDYHCFKKLVKPYLDEHCLNK